ncbi:hypothetical protein DENSPDRAFT_928676 [Dentipellis sp. KUC8613]|nr:hypothetical protein DENSPDRAFT_928676 [Dentipellis sp. KUC8613]
MTAVPAPPLPAPPRPSLSIFAFSPPHHDQYDPPATGSSDASIDSTRTILSPRPQPHPPVHRVASNSSLISSSSSTSTPYSRPGSSYSADTSEGFHMHMAPRHLPRPLPVPPCASPYSSSSSSARSSSSYFNDSSSSLSSYRPLPAVPPSPPLISPHSPPPTIKRSPSPPPPPPLVLPSLAEPPAPLLPEPPAPPSLSKPPEPPLKILTSSSFLVVPSIAGADALISPLSPCGPPPPDEVRKNNLRKLRRHLGASVPPALVLHPSMRASEDDADNTSDSDADAAGDPDETIKVAIEPLLPLLTPPLSTPPPPPPKDELVEPQTQRARAAVPPQAQGRPALEARVLHKSSTLKWIKERKARKRPAEDNVEDVIHALRNLR